MKTPFSERVGQKVPKPVQLNDMDRDLKVSLWNVVQRHQVLFPTFDNDESFLHYELHTKFFKCPADHFLGNHINHWPGLKNWYFDEKRAWYELYELLEFVHEFFASDNMQSGAEFAKWLNNALENENAGYRFLNGEFAPITDEQELAAVNAAVNAPTTGLKPVSMHIQQALKLLSDKVNPDYRNSMKESISAVESLCKMIAGMPAACLSPALEKTAKELDLNDLLRDGFKKIYGYTSDDHGIRHALKDDEEPEQEDARFMLVACSAFVNMVTEKARKKGKLPTATS